MKADQLPGKAADILKQIRKNYKVKFEPLTVQGKELQILQVTDIEPLLAGKDPFKNTDDFPFWVKLWEASMMLAHTIGSLPVEPDSTLLELGAGLAAPGLVAAAMGHKVTLSDYEPIILDFQRVSAAASGLTGVDFKIIDWKKPPKMEQFNTIVGAEILFREEFFAPLLKILKTFLAPAGTIYLAHDMRRKSLNPFLQLAEKDFEIAFSTRKLTSAEETITVVVNRLRRRQ